MSKEELIKEVWNTCTFDEILNVGFEEEKINVTDIFNKAWEYGTFDDILNVGFDNELVCGEDIIKAASEYNDPNKEFSDDEIKEIVKEADISIVIDALEDKYTMHEIINEFNTDEILESFDFSDIFDYFEWDFRDKCEEEYNNGYQEGLEDAKNEIKDNLYTKKDCLNELRESDINNFWCFLCDLFEISYYDNNSFYKKLENLIRMLNKSMYKDKNDAQWISINID